MDLGRQALVQYLCDCQDSFHGKPAGEVEAQLQEDWPDIYIDICAPREEPVFLDGVGQKLACVIHIDASGKVISVAQPVADDDAHTAVKHRTSPQRRSVRTRTRPSDAVERAAGEQCKSMRKRLETITPLEVQTRTRTLHKEHAQVSDDNVDAVSPIMELVGSLNSPDGDSRKQERIRRKSHVSTKSPKSKFNPEERLHAKETTSPLHSPKEKSLETQDKHKPERNKTKTQPASRIFSFPLEMPFEDAMNETLEAVPGRKTSVRHGKTRRASSHRGSLVSPASDQADEVVHRKTQRRPSSLRALPSPPSDQTEEVVHSKTHRRPQARESLLSPSSDQADEMLHGKTHRRPASRGSLLSPASDQAEDVAHGKTHRRPPVRGSLRSPASEQADEVVQGKTNRRSSARGSIRSRLRTSTPPRDEDCSKHTSSRPVRAKRHDSAKVVHVHCCVYPVLQNGTKCLQQEESKCIKFSSRSSLADPEHSTFNFDGVFYPDFHENVFDECKDIVQGVVEGHDGNIFLFGSEDAGKTLTLFGTVSSHINEVDDAADLCDLKGIIPLSFKEVFKELESKTAGPDYFCVTCSVMEIQVLSDGTRSCLDLLDDYSETFEGFVGSFRRALTVEEGHIICQKMSQQECIDALDLMDCVHRGLKKRGNGAGALVVTVRIVSENEETLERSKGKLVLCDLMQPSKDESLESAKAVATQREVNALRDVLCGLQATPPIRPATREILPNLLSDTLDVTARTALFINCSPSSDCEEATFRSLQYGAHVVNASNPELRPQMKF